MSFLNLSYALPSSSDHRQSSYSDLQSPYHHSEFTPVTKTVLLPFEYTETPALGPLHWLFPLPGICFPRYSFSLKLLYQKEHLFTLFKVASLLCCCCLVSKSCPTLCDPKDCSMARFPCPFLFPGVCSNSCALSRRCYLTMHTPNPALLLFKHLLFRDIVLYTCLFL